MRICTYHTYDVTKHILISHVSLSQRLVKLTRPKIRQSLTFVRGTTYTLLMALTKAASRNRLFHALLRHDGFTELCDHFEACFREKSDVFRPRFRVKLNK